MGILWDGCPLILLCVCVRAGRVQEKGKTASGAHAATKHGNIFKLYVYRTFTKKRAPTYCLTKVRPEFVFFKRV